MSTILVLGFMLGMRHALEADHIAAVATLVKEGNNNRRVIFQGAVWGLGHTITLFLVCSAVLFLDAVVPERLAQVLEMIVGVMLVILGIDVLRRMLRQKVHFHVHKHSNGETHFHAHSHAGDVAPHTSAHHHEHTQQFPIRALCIGLMHGLAGSAALILITLDRVGSPFVGLIYVGLFGIGSIVGMAVLSLVINIPLQRSRHFTWLHNGMQLTVGLATIIIGSLLFYENISQSL